MQKPILVIMAAGMGSRYGGLKQIDPIDEDGHIIIDYSLYDAKKAGFEKAIFIIKKDDEQVFREAIGNRISQYMDVDYAFQEIYNLPVGFSVPEGRTKPWGTAHAILSCKGLVDGPFAVINADDYYGKEAFRLLYDFLSTAKDNLKYQFTMVGYHLDKTVTENGHVSRGICNVNHKNELVSVVERTRIEKQNMGVAYTEDDGISWVYVPNDTIVSMNTWGFSQGIIGEIEKRFPDFLRSGLKENPLKCEFFLPTVVSELLDEKKATVRVLDTSDQWYGVTYKEDKPTVVNAIRKMKEEGKYPKHLWEGDE